MNYPSVFFHLILCFSLSACTDDDPVDIEPEKTPVELLVDASEATAEVRRHNGLLRSFRGHIQTNGASPEDRARGFLETHGAALGLSDFDAELSLREVRSADGTDVVILSRMVEDVPVFSSEIRVAMDSGGYVTYVGAALPASLDVSTMPEISQEDAETALRNAVEAQLAESVTPLDATLGIYDPSLSSDVMSDPRLSWFVRARVQFPTEDEPSSELSLAHIDAANGDVLFLGDGIQHVRNRKVYGIQAGYLHQEDIVEDAHELWFDESGELPEPDPPGITVVSRADGFAQEVYDALGSTQDYFDARGWNSWDNRGSPINVYIGFPPTRTQWAPWLQSMFLHRWDTNLSGVAHEYTHAVSQTIICQEGLSECRLLSNTGEPGALSEHYSDIFASFITGDWLHEDRVTAIRDLAHSPLYPGLSRSHYCLDRRNEPDYPPDHCYRPMEIEPCPTEDEPERQCAAEFPHDNSGIPSLAAVLWTDGGEHPHVESLRIDGIGRTKVERIYWRAYYLYMQGSSTFEDLRFNLLRACEDYATQVSGTTGITYEDCGWVLNAFHAVGVGEPDTDMCGAEICPDTWGNSVDNCPRDFNPLQEDSDFDGVGDACEDAPDPDAGITDAGVTDASVEADVETDAIVTWVCPTIFPTDNNGELTLIREVGPEPYSAASDQATRVMCQYSNREGVYSQANFTLVWFHTPGPFQSRACWAWNREGEESLCSDGLNAVVTYNLFNEAEGEEAAARRFLETLLLIAEENAIGCTEVTPDVSGCTSGPITCPAVQVLTDGRQLPLAGGSDVCPVSGSDTGTQIYAICTYLVEECNLGAISDTLGYSAVDYEYWLTWDEEGESRIGCGDGEMYERFGGQIWDSVTHRATVMFLGPNDPLDDEVEAMARGLLASQAESRAVTCP